MSSNTKSQHPRDAIAERNLQAILDATERLVSRGEPPTISAIASEAGVSRPTVYAHFPDRQRLHEALVEQAVQRSMAAIQSAEPDKGPALAALLRVLRASWEELDRHEAIARAAAAELSADAMRRAHHAAREVLLGLVDRGRREGAFRTDLPAAWLVTSYLALIHATAEGTRTGELDPETAADALSELVTDLFVGRGDRSEARQPHGV